MTRSKEQSKNNTQQMLTGRTSRRRHDAHRQMGMGRWADANVCPWARATLASPSAGGVGSAGSEDAEQDEYGKSCLQRCDTNAPRTLPVEPVQSLQSHYTHNFSIRASASRCQPWQASHTPLTTCTRLVSIVRLCAIVSRRPTRSQSQHVRGHCTCGNKPAVGCDTRLSTQLAKHPLPSSRHARVHTSHATQPGSRIGRLIPHETPESTPPPALVSPRERRPHARGDEGTARPGWWPHAHAGMQLWRHQPSTPN